jgi:hypothetical protein
MRHCCRKDKERENISALEVLPDLLTELDKMTPPQRLLALVQASAAAAAPAVHATSIRQRGVKIRLSVLLAYMPACLPGCRVCWLPTSLTGGPRLVWTSTKTQQYWRCTVRYMPRCTADALPVHLSSALSGGMHMISKPPADHLPAAIPGLTCCLQARSKLSQRPWRVDDFDEFAEVLCLAMLLPCVPAAEDQPLPCAGKAMNSAAAHICGSPHSLLQVWFSKSHLNEDGEGEQGCIVSVCLLACLLARLLTVPLLSQSSEPTCTHPLLACLQARW